MNENDVLKGEPTSLKLSIELVPRDVSRLRSEASEITERYPQIEWLNIPDIKAIPVRSHDAAMATAKLPLCVIPHIRARDRSLEETLSLLADLAEAGVRDALIVTGDRLDEAGTSDPITSLDVLRAANEAGADVKLWAAFDPYRGEMRSEFEYAQAKLQAGAVGLFTQPFFDVRLAEICLDQLAGVPTFIGITPVTTEKSRAYWERTNRVVFPSTFQPTLEHCAELGAALLDVVARHCQNAYLMPIKVDPFLYVESVFRAANARGVSSATTVGTRSQGG